MKLTAVVLAQPLTIPAELLEERNHCRVVMIGETGARHKRVQVTHVLLLRHYSNNNLRHARFPSKSINKGTIAFTGYMLQTNLLVLATITV